MTRAAVRTARDTLTVPLRGTTAHLTWDDRTVYAWYRLGNRRWAFLSTDERERIVAGQAAGYGALTDRTVRLRTTHRPYPAYQWAQQADARFGRGAPNPHTWAELLDDTQTVLRGMDSAEPEHYLGVEVGPRSVIDLVLAHAPMPGTLWRRARLHERSLRILKSDIAEVDRVVGEMIGGRRATPIEVAYLVGRSRALGVPQAPAGPDPHGMYGPTDMHHLVDGVEITEQPFGRYLTVTDHRMSHPDHPAHTRYVTVLTLGPVDEVRVPPVDLPLLSLALSVGFPVEMVLSGKVMTGADVKMSMGRTITRVESQLRDYAEAGEVAPATMTRRGQHARQVADELDSPVPALSARWRGWVRFAVSGTTPEQTAARAAALQKVFMARHIPLVVEPQTVELAAEFVPHSPVAYGSYVRQWPVAMLGASLPQIASTIGDRQGFLIGHTTVGPRRPVLHDPHYGQSIDGSGFVPIIGGLGSGKSFLAGEIIDQIVTAGIRTTVVDPSAGAFAALAGAPRHRGHARVLDLAHGKPGSMSPWAVLPDPARSNYPPGPEGDQEHAAARAEAGEERKLLAADVLLSLLPHDIGTGGSIRMVINDAVEQVGGNPGGSLLDVVAVLEGAADDTVQRCGRYLRNVSHSPKARLFFGAGEVEPITETLVVITFSGLIVPQVNSDRSLWTPEEQIAVPLLNLAVALAFRRGTAKPKGERHAIVFDEAGILEQFASFRALFTRMARDSRKLNLTVYKLDQTPDGLIGMGLLPFIGGAFVGVADDKGAALRCLDVLGITPDAAYADVIRELPRPGPDQPLDYRDFVYRDPAGRVDRVRVSAAHRRGLAELLNTTPRDRTTTPPQSEAAPPVGFVGPATPLLDKLAQGLPTVGHVPGPRPGEGTGRSLIWDTDRSPA